MNLANLHPLLVHLPIGIFILAFLLELWQWIRKKDEKETILFILATTIFFSLLSIATGWFLGDNGGYDVDMLNNHKWMGIAFTLCAITLFVLRYCTKAIYRKIYNLLLVIGIVLLSLTGHFGGNMTHGEDFLFTDHSPKAIAIANIEKAQVYAELVQPVLEAKCVSCHNTSKTKGGLLLTSKAEILAGGESGLLFDTISGHYTNLFMHRLHLPMEDDEHMPPKGKQQLSAEEITLLDWWIKNENCFDCTVEDLEKDSRLEPYFASLEEDQSDLSQLAKNANFIPREDLERITKMGISLQQLSEDNPLLIANFNRQKNITTSHFDALENIASNVVEINLSYTNFNDDLITALKPYNNLIKLQLNNTTVTDKGIEKLKNKPYLTSLNLFGTPIKKLNSEQLGQHKKLTHVYVTPQSLTQESITSLSNANIILQGLDINEKFKASKITSPVIVANQEVFKDSLRITIETSFEEATTYFGVVNKTSDTLFKVYTNPFFISKTQTVLAFSEKEGWGKSEYAKRDFIKSGIPIKEGKLHAKPHEKYAAQHEVTLFDGKRGSTNFVDGKWLGYEEQNFKGTFLFDDNKEISSISVSHLSAPTSWIFSPIGYKVIGITENGAKKTIKTIDLGKNKPNVDVQRNLITLEFDAIKVKGIQLEIVNQGKNPEWHTDPGGNSFIFIDEVVLN
ncbi:hypothetical protein BUL40_08125 [Croceivirga radicis]|uniref:Uncharacterized protein n=1 Tax=Croceivirga radicis TaxID=1929488 RepID=A0A1V6LSF8_9FLAO|nr:DUF2231 domain-containing protein [Croceivirga radicis]OQD43049.1 hypothetical protein BUL40_08125 [Croceivirga radicis]